MPFVLGYALRLVFEDKIRYGEKILHLKRGIIEIYQVVFKELTGIYVRTYFT